MDEGTNKYSGTQLRKFKKLNGIKLNISTQKNKIEGSFQVISSQVEQGFELLDQVLNFPKFNKSDLEKVLKQIEASLKIDQSDLSTLSNNKFNKNISNYRKKMIYNMQSLLHLDNREVTPDERRIVNAWGKNGKEGEM